ncbi:AraC family transcriptional regulator [Amycolatopsis pigmentata]|uniref:AraC family transcriptional regulator n=1 Tax=Amycolatopsis pigmentata TaxID=450801 RepID=A0ABW5G085_9PSEU
MDVISQAINSVRVGRGTVRKFRQSGRWGMRYSGLTGSGFHFVLRGDGWLLAPDAPPKALRSGDVVLIPSGADHGLSHAPGAFGELPLVRLGVEQPASGPADFEFLCGAYRLDRGQVHPYLTAMPGLLVVSPDYGRDPKLRSLASLLADESADQEGTAVTWPALLDLMLVHVLRQWLSDTIPADRPDIADPAIAAVLRTIHDSPSEPWTVSRLAETVGLSRTALTKRFTALVGKPPMTYLTDWRLNCAARLLRETDAPLAAVARQVGYSSEFAFAGAFRRAYGMPPGRFRVAKGRPAHQTAGSVSVKPAQ